VSRRILALWLPTFATDRLCRVRAGGDAGRAATLRARPLATTLADRGRLVLAAVNAAAAGEGLAPGLTVADARARLPGLATVAAAPDADARALAGLADWCGRYTPWVATCGDAGLVLDVTGCAHLFGGEAGLLTDAATRLARFGYAARGAVAGTPAAAWAIATVGQAYTGPGTAPGAAIVAPEALAAALAPLPVAGLRLDAAAAAGLDRLGLRRIGDLYGVPPATLARRFGPAVPRRLDQALGRRGEPISPRRTPPAHAARIAFAEPIARTADVAAALDRLLAQVCAGLEQAGQGGRRFQLAAYRVDGAVQRLEVGTAGPTRRPAHVRRLFDERLDRLDAGFGIEVLALAVTAVEPLAPAQLGLAGGTGTDGREGGGDDGTALAELVDRLGNRIGLDAVFRPVPYQSHLPEAAVAAAPVAPPPPALLWPADPPRPLRLLPVPWPVEAVAPVPDDPPVLFRWRGIVHRVVRADGPERLAPEWWRPLPDRDGKDGVRDYYRVEDSNGRRFWLYRAGLYDPARPPRWFLHGLFA